MEKDSHYYVMYYLCLAAGFEPDTAYAISYSSQYVDDSMEGREKILLDQKSLPIGAFEAVRTAHNGFESAGTDVQEKIYYPFHFLPGLKGESFDQKMVTKAGEESDLFQKLVNEALKKKNDYRVGITLHVLADTYSHENFSGLWAWDNNARQVDYLPARKGAFINLLNKLKWLVMRKWFEAAPAVGHAQAYRFPDIPYQNWKYLCYRDDWHSVSNSFKFREGFMSLYESLILKYAKARKLAQRDEPGKVLEMVWAGIRTTGNLNKRCAYWRSVIKDYGKKFNLDIPEKHLRYGKEDWEKRVIRKLKKFGIFKTAKIMLKVPEPEFKKSDYYRFHEEALRHRLDVLEKINEYFSRIKKKKEPRLKKKHAETAIPPEYIKEIKEKRVFRQ